MQPPDKCSLPLITLISDLFDSRRPRVMKKTQRAFVKDPDKVMEEYGLSVTSKRALKSQDPKRMANAMIKELKVQQNHLKEQMAGW